MVMNKLAFYAKLDELQEKEKEYSKEWYKERFRFLIVGWLMKNDTVRNVIREIVTYCIENGDKTETYRNELREGIINTFEETIQVRR
jgi:hypothetical protein